MECLRNYGVKTWRWLLSSLFLVLGFAACEEHSDIAPMYGCPSATFAIKGKVENARGQGLNEVRVVIPLYEASDTVEGIVTREEYGDTLYTNQDGLFVWKHQDFPEDQEFELRFYDLSPEGGRIACLSDTLKVRLLAKDLKKSKGDGVWYQGHVEKEITVVLKEKRDE